MTNIGIAQRFVLLPGAMMLVEPMLRERNEPLAKPRTYRISEHAATDGLIFL
jgi:hypothetical protein